ncbi:MAG: hypothetical protein AVDCRST_MAG79-1693, partial [uncultured Thermoleophilia bacterium]
RDVARRHAGRHRDDLLRPRLEPLAARAARGNLPRAGRLARPRPRLDAVRRRARARADRGSGGRGGVPRRLDVPRQPAQRARRRAAPLDHLAHGLDRHPLERRDAPPDLLALPPARRVRARRRVLPGHVGPGGPSRAVARGVVRHRGADRGPRRADSVL